MTFDTQQLYDTHKRKFCVGSSVDPAHIHSRISGKAANSIERKDKDLNQSVSEQFLVARSGKLNGYINVTFELWA